MLSSLFRETFTKGKVIPFPETCKAFLTLSFQGTEVPTVSSLGDRLAQARRELAVRLRKDITQLDVAKAVGASAATVSRWEANDAIPREDALAKLAKYFGVTPAFLRYGVVEHPQSVTMLPEIVAGRGSPSEPITEAKPDRKKKA